MMLNPVSIITGIITKAEPLEVTIVNDQKLILNKNTIINSNLYEDLTLSDKDIFAYILVLAESKKYYILDTYTEDD